MQQLRLVRIPYGYLLLSGGLLRLTFMLFSGKLQEAEYWEYGQIAQQLLEGHGYSFPFTDAMLQFLPEQYYPSALMPPGYVFFLLPFLLISDAVLRHLLLFSMQTALSLLAMYLVYSWSEKRFSKPASLLILLLQVLYPEMIYATCTVGPTIWFHLLFAGLLYSLSEKKHPVFNGVLAAFLVLMRAEALLPAGLLIMNAYLPKQKKAFLVFALTLICCLLPWLIRNQLQFGKPMLAASAGVNIFRGNNPGEIGDWPVFTQNEEHLLRAERGTFEQKIDSMAMKRAWTWITENPAAFLVRLPEKLARFWLLDWPDPRAHHLLYLLPWFFCLPAGIAGLTRRPFAGRAQLLTLFGSYSLIVLIFFPQIRYLTLVKFFWLIPAGLGFYYLWHRLFPESKFLSSGG